MSALDELGTYEKLLAEGRTTAAAAYEALHEYRIRVQRSAREAAQAAADAAARRCPTCGRS